MDVTLRRQLNPDDILCEAGQLVGDASCLCAIEGSVIEGYVDPASIESFCAGDYAACSTWRASKEVEARGGDLKRIIAAQQAENSRRRSQTILREARLRAAQERIASNSPEGRALRRRLGLKEVL